MTSSPELRHALDGLLAATPEPPPPDTDATDVLDWLRAVVSAREDAVRELALCGSDGGAGVVLDPECEAILELVAERDQRWAALGKVAGRELVTRLRTAQRLATEEPSDS